MSSIGRSVCRLWRWAWRDSSGCCTARPSRRRRCPWPPCIPDPRSALGAFRAGRCRCRRPFRSSNRRAIRSRRSLWPVQRFCPLPSNTSTPFSAFQWARMSSSAFCCLAASSSGVILARLTGSFDEPLPAGQILAVEQRHEAFGRNVVGSACRRHRPGRKQSTPRRRT